MGKYNIISIERQYGSGGRQIGSLVAEKLGINFYNDEILKLAAKKINISEEYLYSVEEAASASLMYAMSMVGNFASFSTDLQLPDKLFYEESEIIKELALNGRCVLVGRCAGNVLSDRKDCLKVFIYAHEDVRIKRSIEEYEVSEKDAYSKLISMDKRRSNFFNAHSDKKWNKMDNYDICLDSGKLGIKTCVEIIGATVENHI